MTRAGVDKYLTILQNFDRNNLDALCECVSVDVRFVDPFNDVSGRTAYRTIFSDMLDNLENHEFEVITIVWSDNIVQKECAKRDAVVFLKWRLSAMLPRLLDAEWEVTGCTELRVNQEGFVTAHIDYWDPSHGLYEKLPFIGWIFRFLRRRLQSSQK
jgi:steroid Delta-isomerase